MSRWATQAAALCRRAPNAQKIVLGREVTYGPVDIVDRDGQDASGAPMAVRHTVATIPADALPSLARFATLTIGGAAYTVRDHNLVEDGLIRHVIVQEVVS